MIPDSIKNLRADYPHLTSLKYYFFPEDYRHEDTQYQAALTDLIATDIIAAQYIFDHPKMSFSEKASEWLQSHDPRDLRNIALVITVIFFVVIACVLVGIVFA